MRWLTGALALTAMIGSVALADTAGYTMTLPDSSNLGGGVLIAHYCEPIGYSSDPPALGWCEEYLAEYAIDNCNDQVNRIDTDTYLPASWYVLAAWREPKVCCGVEFGFGDYTAEIFGFAEYNCCFPVNGLEVPTGEWPGPNQGIAIVVMGTDSWEGNFLPMMHFGGYAYGSYGIDTIPLDVNPTTDKACFVNCESPPSEYVPDELGAMGINTDGVWVSPGEPPPLTVCCLDDGSCVEVEDENECDGLGGDWNELLDSCDPNPCPQPGVCCFHDGLSYLCNILLEQDCNALSGEWHEELDSCDPFPDVCLPWACIVAEACTTVLETECDGLGGTWYEGLYCSDRHVCCVGIECYIVWEQGCTDLEGEWHPEWDTCDPNPCLVPVYNATWGTIKSIYR